MESLPKLTKEDAKTIQEKGLAQHARKYHLTKEQLDVAYEIALGVKTEEAAETEPIKTAAKMMIEMMDEGFPLNKLLKAIETKKDYDTSIETFFTIVENMQTSFRSKKILQSIVKQRRAGKLIIINGATNQPIGEIDTKTAMKNSEYSSTDIAAELIVTLSRFKNSKVEFTFIDAPTQ